MTPTDAKDETPLPTSEEIIDLAKRCDAASRDERLADGMLYRRAGSYLWILQRELLAAQTENERLARELDHFKKYAQGADDEIRRLCRACDTNLERAETAEAALSAANQQRSDEGERRCATIARLTAELSAERAAREAAQRERDTLHEQVGETISCEHVRQGDSTVTRLHFCHACRDLTKQAYLAARGSHEA